MKILIADDEKMVRLTLISMLRDLNLSLENIYEADNGERLLKLLQKYTPDIAFVDIKMPKLEGLEAIRLAKEAAPLTKWVILTAFPEFEFAKQAVELGVSKYLLKPISPQLLQETITALSKDSFANYYDLNKQFERDIIALYNKFDLANETALEDIITKSNFEAAVFFFDGNCQNDLTVRQRKSFISELSMFIDGLLSNYVRIALFKISDTQIATVCAYDPIKNSTGAVTFDAYFSKAAALVPRYSRDGLRITMVRSAIFQSYKMVNQILAQIANLGPLRVICGTGCTHSVPALTEFLNNSQAYLEFSRLILELSGYYNDKKYLFYHTGLRQLEQTLTKCNLRLDGSMQQKLLAFLNVMIENPAQ
jgi:two-component system response regulator YesN